VHELPFPRHCGETRVNTGARTITARALALTWRARRPRTFATARGGRVFIGTRQYHTFRIRSLQAPIAFLADKKLTCGFIQCQRKFKIDETAFIPHELLHDSAAIAPGGIGPLRASAGATKVPRCKKNAYYPAFPR